MALPLNLDKLKLGKSKRETMLLAGVIFAAVAVAYFYIFFRPAVGKLGELFPDVSNLGIKLGEARRDIANRARFEDKKKSLESKIDYYEKGLPSQKEIPKFLESLSEIAKQAGIKIIGVKPIEGSKEGAMIGEIYQEIPIDVNAKGGYHQLGDFLNSLETGDRFMKIEDLYIESDSSNVTKHRVRFKIITYTLSKEK